MSDDQNPTESRREMDKRLAQRLDEIDDKFDEIRQESAEKEERDNARYKHHEELINGLRAEDAQMREHVEHLRKSVKHVQGELETLKAQSVRTRAEIQAMRIEQRRTNRTILKIVHDIREKVGSAFEEALKSTPNSVRLVLEILAMLATFMLVFATFHHH